MKLVSVKSQNTFNSDFKYLIIILLCCLLAYWPLTFHIYSLKNDAITVFLPFRFQISEAIYNGHWPFWSPYLNLGYPMHSDMQAGAWNPFVHIFSLFGPYTLATLQNETLLYIFLSGVSMFYLLKHLSVRKKVSLLCAISFMLCGYISDSAQFLNWIASAAFTPFVFLFYHRLLISRKIIDGLLLSLFLYLYLTCAYPADFILTCYLLLAFFIFYLIKQKEDWRKEDLQNILKLHLLFILTFILLSLPALLSFFEVLPLMERGNGVSYVEAMSNPLHPLLLFSYITPLGVWKAPYVSITDPLERNCFIGILSLILLFGGLLHKSKNKILRFSKWGIFVSLVFSFGEIGGIRPLTYYLLPFMDTFRHPANAKLFTLFFISLVAAFTLENHLTNSNLERQRKYSWMATTIFLSIMVTWALIINPITFEKINIPISVSAIKELIDTFSFSEFILLNALIQLPFLIALYFFYVKKTRLNSLITLSLINLIIHTILFQPFTVVKKDSVETIQSLLTSVQRPGYPPQDLSASLNENSKDGYQYFKELGSANLYNKKIGRLEAHIIPSNLYSQSRFWSHLQLRTTLMKYPFLYRADTILQSLASSNKNYERKRILYIDTASCLTAIEQKPIRFPYSAKTIHFSPNSFSFELNSKSDGFYCLFQNLHHRWRLLIDGKESEIIPVNVAFMGFKLKAGNHIVSFNYEAKDLKFASYLSICTFVFILISFISTYVKKTTLTS